MKLDESFAGELANIALAGIHRAYPNKIAHQLFGDADARPPRELTPLFYGCFDWHSAVHSHWTLATLQRLFPDASWAGQVQAALAKSFVAEHAAAELRYAEMRPGFEMPYGVAWLLRLGAELTGEWATVIEPLVRLRRDQLVAWLNRLPAPIRTGEHNQTAFAMGFALDAARASGDTELEHALCRRARDFHAGDRDAPLAYEPSAFDFLSPALAEVDLMRRVLAPADFATWFDAFLPHGTAALTPVTPSDRSNGKLVHYDGLNLSRAWMLRAIAETLPPAHPHRTAMRSSATEHLDEGLIGLRSGHYAGTHWLPSFALVALLPDPSRA